MRGIHVGNKFKETDIMPTEGQFVAVYEYGGKIWSDILKWEDGKLLEYFEKENTFEPVTPENCDILSERENIKFYTL